MTPEELLKTLKDGGMEDQAIEQLLNATLEVLKGATPPEEKPEDNPPADEEAERAEAGKLLGVTL